MAEPQPIPRLIVAGVSSGVGKTTIVVGLCRALRARGLKVAVFKCGPDYLDPTYHARAANALCHNLDGWMMGRDAVMETFARGARAADIAVIEGLMGLFDGASPTGEEGSTAEIAKWLRAPVLLVVDASGMARTLAAVSHGFVDFDREVRIAGLVCNRVGSRGHVDLLRKAVGGLPILGALPEVSDLAFPERHLGLHTADERAVPDGVLSAWGERVAEWFDIDTIIEAARNAPRLPQAPPADRRTPIASRRCRIGIAFDEAFHFYYEDNLQRLSDLGVELVRFSPLRETELPKVDGLYFGGGYPEAHAEALSRNEPMQQNIAAFAAAGGPIYAECGGLMYLSAGIRTLDGHFHPMVSIFPAEAVMHDRLQALGYVEVETQERSILGPAGLRFRGHQFRYSDLRLSSGEAECIFSVRRRRGGEVFREGYRSRNVLGSYVHAHWASNPLAAEGFARACGEYARSAR